MRMTRQIAAIALAVFALWSATAQAQPYPSKDIHLICGFPPGGGADLIVRFYAEKLRLLTGRTIVVENKVGALGNIATQYTARAKPDGYTIYITGGPGLAANMYLFKKPPVDIVKDLQVVAGINRLATMLAVRADRPWKTLADLTAYLKEKGDRASYASNNPVAQAIGEIYKQSAGLKTVQINYKTSSDSSNDIQSGAVDFGIFDPVYAIAQQREGRMRILAISSNERMESQPDLLTFEEQGVPMDLLGWWAAFVPAATPRPIVDQLNKWFTEIQSTPEAKAFFNSYGSDPFLISPDQGQARLTEDVKKWAEYVKIANIEPQ